MTPFATGCIVGAWIKNREDQTEISLLQAYQTAALSLSDPKKFPRTFRDWIGKPKKRAAPQSDQQKWAAFVQWAGGDPEKAN